MKEIFLTQGKVALVSDEDFERTNRHKWYAREDNPGLWYACRKTKVLGLGWRQQFLHRFIMGLEHGDRKQIDHVDGNGLNCQKSNLRFSTQKENVRNCRKRKNTSSSLKGVTWHKKDRRWQAQITVDRRYIFLGQFSSEQEAHEVYAEAAQKYFGEFARLS